MNGWIIFAVIVVILVIICAFIVIRVRSAISALNPFDDGRPRGVGTIPLTKACSPGERDDGASCWLDSYGRGPGRIPDKTPCPDGTRDDGVSCWRDTYGRGAGYALWDLNKCNAENRQGCEQYGAMYYPKCKSGYHPVGCCLCEPDGGPGIKVTLIDRQKCQPGEEKNGSLCYTKCKSGFNAVGCCICEPVGGPRVTKTLFDRQYCSPGQQLDAALCYQPCNADENGVGPVCWKK